VSGAEAAAAAAIVRLEGVGKVFPGGVEALAGLDLAVHPGEFVTLLGASGCGKSTALRLLAGLAVPTRGRIAWGDGARPRLGFVFQEPTLMPWATALDNVATPLRVLGEPAGAARARAAAALAQVGLAEFAGAHPRQLSGGMRMRVSIARALAVEPRVLLMDEPFAALDEIARFRLNDDLRALWQARGLTVVFVTHSVFESVYLSTRVVVLTPRPGRVAAEVALDAEPRDAGFRTSAAYAARCREVSARLGAALGAA
jgi:NitT/TauT family transport system ATP-binding protein